jgi:hypothetical protein
MYDNRGQSSSMSETLAESWRSGAAKALERDEPGLAREDWTMPPLELLARPEWSRTRTVGMYALRGYLLLAVVMLIVKAIEVGIGH